MKELILVFVGGGSGSICRFLLGKWLNSTYFFPPYPTGTLLANVLGCFLIGLISSWFEKHFGKSQWTLLLTTGFCGGFTTFSTFSMELVKMTSQQRMWEAMLYLGVSIAVGFGAVGLGVQLVK
jgi:CrcB protein